MNPQRPQAGVQEDLPAAPAYDPLKDRHYMPSVYGPEAMQTLGIVWDNTKNEWGTILTPLQFEVAKRGIEASQVGNDRQQQPNQVGTSPSGVRITIEASDGAVSALSRTFHDMFSARSFPHFAPSLDDSGMDTHNTNNDECIVNTNECIVTLAPGGKVTAIDDHPYGSLGEYFEYPGDAQLKRRHADTPFPGRNTSHERPSRSKPPRRKLGTFGATVVAATIILTPVAATAAGGYQGFVAGFQQEAPGQTPTTFDVLKALAHKALER